MPHSKKCCFPVSFLSITQPGQKSSSASTSISHTHHLTAFQMFLNTKWELMNMVHWRVSGPELCLWENAHVHKFQGFFCKTRECCTVVEEFSEDHVCFQDYILFSWSFSFISGFPMERSPVKSLICKFTRISNWMATGSQIGWQQLQLLTRTS